MQGSAIGSNWCLPLIAKKYAMEWRAVWNTKQIEMKDQTGAASVYQVRNYERFDQAEQFKRGSGNTGPQDMMMDRTGGGEVVQERNILTHR